MISASPATSVLVQHETSPPSGWNEYLCKWGYDGFHLQTEWATVFAKGLRHRPQFLWAEQDRRIVGVLPLMHITGPVFGSFLVSQPYLNTGGVLADSPLIASQLIDKAAYASGSVLNHW